ncbi:hypothetical protein KKC87_00260, partial [Patescibacteria group bacterium]|nr:hypothetical protein [Patescibacteria group bacterium]
MGIFSQFQLPILLICVGLNSLLAILVLRSNRRSHTNIIFASLSLIISIWLVIMYLAINPRLDLYWARASIIVATPMSVCFFLFSYALPATRLVLKKWHLLAIFILIEVVAVINSSSLAFRGIEIIGGKAQIVAGPGMMPFMIVTTFFSVAAIFFLFKKSISGGRKAKNQIRLILFGMFVMLALIIISIPLPIILFKNSSFVPLAPFYTLIFLTTTAVSILKYNLFDIRILATEMLVAVLVFILLIEGIFSKSIVFIALKIFFAIILGILGDLLVKSVNNEIKRRREISHLLRSLELANTRLKKMDKQKSEFLSIAAHQLRTPLSIAKGFIELIKDKAYGKTTKEMDKTLDKMNQSNERLINLVDEFLDISRIEQGRNGIKAAKIDLGKIVDDVVEEFKGEARSKDIKLSRDDSSKLPLVEADIDKIRHVLFNYLDNAVKYNSGNIIQVKASIKGPGVSLVVKDNGIG